MSELTKKQKELLKQAFMSELTNEQKEELKRLADEIMNLATSVVDD